jgi:hypothetical protein
MGPVYYAKGRPVIDVYLHSARLVLIVVVVSLTAPHGLLPASIGMSVVEGSIVIVGQWMVNGTLALSWRQFGGALGPGLRNSILAAIATETGRLIASAVGLHGPAALAAIIVLPAIALGWLELPALIAMAKGSIGGDEALNSSAAPEQAP